MNEEINTVETEPTEEKKYLRDSLYSKIHISLKTMDRIIAVVVAALIISIVCGIIF